MTPRLSPTRDGALLVRVALVVGLALTAVAVWATLPAPPDYQLPPLNDPAAVADVRELVSGEIVGGSGMQARPSISRVDLASGHQVIVAFGYSDQPLPVPDAHTTVVDALHECIRIVVTTDGPAPPEDALATYVERRRDQLRAWLSEAPRDPCLGRPLQP